MFGGGSVQLVRLFGIRIGAHPSWFIVLFLFIFLLSDQFQAQLDGSETQAYVVSVLAVLLFFVSLVAHELGHAVMAQRLGIGVSGIDLWLLGGLAKMTRDTHTAGEEFKVAVAGPVVTAVVVVLCGGLSALIVGGEQAFEIATFQNVEAPSAVLALLTFLATINLALLVFNLLPAFPLDGGRLAKAAVWRVTGDRFRATRLSGYLGQGFGWILLGYGVFIALAYDAIFNGLWLGVLGWFIAQGARSAVVSTGFSQRLEGITVADIMDSRPVAMPADTPVLEAQEAWFLRYGWDFFPVVDDDGRFLGLARQQQVAQAVGDGKPALAVHELVRGDAQDWRVGTDAPVENLLGSEPLGRLGALMAVDGEGVLRGVVTIEQVRRAVAAALPGRT